MAEGLPPEEEPKNDSAEVTNLDDYRREPEPDPELTARLEDLLDDKMPSDNLEKETRRKLGLPPKDDKPAS